MNWQLSENNDGGEGLDYNQLCLQCFGEKETDICPRCGFSLSRYEQQPNCLAIPVVLKGQYIVGMPLGVGGFGITYAAFDSKVGGVCAIKEYMPDTVSYRYGTESQVRVSYKKDVFEHGLVRFVEEAELLQKFSHSRNIINVYDSFYENGTAYYVMEYLEGQDLKSYTHHFRERLDYAFGLTVLDQVMNGLEELHREGVLHRDISPDNIYITKNGLVKILDFGSARYKLVQEYALLSVIIKMGYAPIEQYNSRARQGPYSDIYALGATMYHLFGGSLPPEATERVLEDQWKPLCQINPAIPQAFSRCIDKAMAVKSEDRYQSIAELRADIGRISQPAQPKAHSYRPPPAAPAPSRPKPAAVPPSPPKQYRPPVKESNVFLRRMAAAAIDFALYLLGLLLLFGGISAITDSMGMVGSVAQVPRIILLFLSPVLFVLLSATLESSGMRGTIGKKLCGLVVVGQNGEALDSRITLKRNFIKLLGIFLLLSEKDGEYLHNRLTNVTVMRKGVVNNESIC